LGGDEHPSAQESTLLVKNVLEGDRNLWRMRMEIHKSLLAILLKPTLVLGNGSQLWIFDWKTGEKIAVGVMNTIGDYDNVLTSCYNTGNKRPSN
jgi:hypothetical protein